MNNIQNHNTDCFFFTNVQDMGANIPTCNYHHKLGYCPCNKCDNYVSKSKVYEIVYRYLKEKKNQLKRQGGE